ncbi:hypothetical protein [Ancylobacter amanitiformis]|uniref:Uncharacterized protein n=1 Tax=Ancylobacter amanitiformis TaxID=217069 RepID=A0ABU0LQG6_9HYPH|nr:hypothetical protein [Ancylobacter amanitiformis]MDQ0510916.1 hypothetical protein [Ancylobacter amanitiformis]
MYLTDRQRAELCLPAHVMMGVLFAGVVEQDAEFTRAVELLKTAAREPITDLDDRKARKLLERVRRLHHQVVQPYAGEGEDVAKFGLIAFFWIKMLVESGYFIFAEGSAIDEALRLYIGAIEHKAEEPRVVASAEKQARKMIRRLQAQGYYAGLGMDAAAISAGLGEWPETAP